MSQSPVSWFWDKVMPSLMVAACVGSGTAAWAMYRTVEDMKLVLSQQDSRMAQMEARQNRMDIDMARMAGQMVGWDTLKRIELALQTLSAAGKGDKAMQAMSSAIRAEIESRREQR